MKTKPCLGLLPCEPPTSQLHARTEFMIHFPLSPRSSFICRFLIPLLPPVYTLSFYTIFLLISASRTLYKLHHRYQAASIFQCPPALFMRIRVWNLLTLSAHSSSLFITYPHPYYTAVLQHLLTYSMVQSPSWEANWFAASQEIPRISRNPKVHYRTHKRPPPVSILGQPNLVHIPTSHLLEIRPNIIHPSTPRSPQWSFSFRFHYQDPIHPSLLTHTRHMPSPSHSSRFYHLHNIGWGVQII